MPSRKYCLRAVTHQAVCRLAANVKSSVSVCWADFSAGTSQTTVGTFSADFSIDCGLHCSNRPLWLRSRGHMRQARLIFHIHFIQHSNMRKFSQQHGHLERRNWNHLWRASEAWKWWAKAPLFTVCTVSTMLGLVVSLAVKYHPLVWRVISSHTGAECTC